MFIRQKTKHNSGITLIETMLAILIFSIISAVISAFLVSSLKGYRKMQDRIRIENNMMLLEMNLSGEIRRISPPYWSLPQQYGSEENSEGISLMLPWYDGDLEQTLVVASDNKGVRIITPHSTLAYAGISLSVLAHVFEDGKNYITATLTAGKTSRDFLFMFSSFGVPDE